MEVWPAIDLRDGRCVRLIQGDFARQIVFGNDPAAVARSWVEQGADRLHLVDLDGARTGKPGNFDAVRRIVEAVDVPCQLGGGIRSEEVILEYLNMGVSRLVVGTMALRQPDWFRQLSRQFPGRMVLGVDARRGRVATDGWLETSDVAAEEMAAQWDDEPLAAIVYTDIATDGMLSGPNLKAMAAMQRAVRLPVIASGGIRSRRDVAQLAAAGMAGCIIGRALYEGTMTLAEAIRAAGGRDAEVAD